MQTNKAVRYNAKTEEGAAAFAHMTPMQALRRSVLSCLLWESSFYCDGESIADRIFKLAADPAISSKALGALAIEARSQYHLRHVPLLLLVALAKRGGREAGKAIAETIQRPDELSEFLSLYWKMNPTIIVAANGRPINAPLSKQVKIGLASAFQKFTAHSLAKYNRDGAVKLRDVLFLVHAKPRDELQATSWKQLVEGKLPPPDTWEVELSAGKDKRQTFSRLIMEGKLGYLALLRNLRNMVAAGVDLDVIRMAIKNRKGAERVLPFRYVAAARACPMLEPAIDEALCAALTVPPPLRGTTAVMVDVSRSMKSALSSKSDLTRMDAAAALASMIMGDVRVFSFSNHLVEVPPRRGMAGVDAVIKSQPHNGTALFDAVDQLNKTVKYDRLIVITDEQATDTTSFSRGMIQGRIKTMPAPTGKGYCINVGTEKNGVGYGSWIHLDGFSEGVLRWIENIEREADQPV